MGFAPRAEVTARLTLRPRLSEGLSLRAGVRARAGLRPWLWLWLRLRLRLRLNRG
jgi:hypothetical protein